MTTSCVALGADAAVPLLDAIAQAGGGKSYNVTNPRTIPRIFVNEARRVARPLIFEESTTRNVCRIVSTLVAFTIRARIE